MHNVSADPAPSEEIHQYDACKALHFLGIVVSDLFFLEHPHILWYRIGFTQCLIFRQCRLRNGKMRGFLMAGRSYQQTYPQKLGREFCDYFS